MLYRKENAKYAMSFTKSHLQIDMTIYVSGVKSTAQQINFFNHIYFIGKS